RRFRSRWLVGRSARNRRQQKRSEAKLCMIARWPEFGAMQVCHGCASKLRGRYLSLFVEKLRHERRPDRYGIGRANKEMSIATERRHQMVFGLATCRRKGLVHAFRQGRAKESVVLDVDPQHRHARWAAERTGRLHPL